MKALLTWLGDIFTFYCGSPDNAHISNASNCFRKVTATSLFIVCGSLNILCISSAVAWGYLCITSNIFRTGVSLGPSTSHCSVDLRFCTVIILQHSIPFPSGAINVQKNHSPLSEGLHNLTTPLWSHFLHFNVLKDLNHWFKKIFPELYQNVCSWLLGTGQKWWGIVYK